jgi:four helix bundle protein
LKKDLLKEEVKPYNIRHRCFYFAKHVLQFVKEAKFDRIYFSMFDQLVRSSTSIGANIIEAIAGSSKRDWKNFYIIALKSANETKYWLCLIRDSLECDKMELNKLIKEADEISKIIASIIINHDKMVGNKK